MARFQGFTFLLFLSSLFINFFLSSHLTVGTPEPGWSLRAAAEAEAVARISCSGHGQAYVDGVSLTADGKPVCECNNCYYGHDCSKLSLNCSADARSGDPLFLQPYWIKHAEASAVVVSGWHRMSYSADGESYISKELKKNIFKLHNKIGNAVTDKKFIVFGVGSTQLLNAAIHALSPDNNSSSPAASVVATIPYYPAYRTQTIFFNSKSYEWKGATSEWKNSSESKTKNFIEFVTSPNNPDGRWETPVLGGSSVIYDHAYYWPHFSAIKKTPSDEDIMLFTISKVTGHAGSRFGWALIKNRTIYERVVNYMGLSTQGVSRDTHLRVLKLIKAMLAGVNTGSGDIFHFGYNLMKDRWVKLSDIVSSSDRFSLQQLPHEYCYYFGKMRDPSPAYAWLKCEWEEDRDCSAVMTAANIDPRAGTLFGDDSRYVRFSLIKSQDDFDMLLERMKALVSKSKAR